jgi:YesN/AraC family two-component response regulator
MESHIHDNLEIIYVLDGEGAYFVVDKVVNLEKGDCLVINNREIHRARVKKDKLFEIADIHFKKSIIENVNIDNRFKPLNLFFNRDKNFSHKVKLTDNLKTEAEYLIKKLVKEQDYTNTRDKQIMIKLYLLELLFIIERALTAQASHNRIGKSVSSEAERVVKEVLDYINNNITKKLTLGYLSKQAIFSPFYFSRIFKDITGFSIKEYINRKRILLAKELLQGQDIRIIDVCYEVGYENLSYFNFIFKKLVGVSPLKYRKISK